MACPPPPPQYANDNLLFSIFDCNNYSVKCINRKFTTTANLRYKLKWAESENDSIIVNCKSVIVQTRGQNRCTQFLTAQAHLLLITPQIVNMRSIIPRFDLLNCNLWAARSENRCVPTSTSTSTQETRYTILSTYNILVHNLSRLFYICGQLISYIWNLFCNEIVSEVHCSTRLHT